MEGRDKGEYSRFERYGERQFPPERRKLAAAQVKGLRCRERLRPMRVKSRFDRVIPMINPHSGMRSRGDIRVKQISGQFVTVAPAPNRNREGEGRENAGTEELPDRQAPARDGLRLVCRRSIRDGETAAQSIRLLNPCSHRSLNSAKKPIRDHQKVS
jgi:hypothetical protein